MRLDRRDKRCWFRWCRSFTIRGILLCPDGHPVRDAKVCGYDVDWWWKGSTKQVVGAIKACCSDAFRI